MKKAKAQNELMLAREVKNNKKRFFGYVRSKKKSKEVVGSVCGDDGVMVADRDKAEVFNTFFASVFSQKEKDIQLGENESKDPGKGRNFRIVTAIFGYFDQN